MMELYYLTFGILLFPLLCHSEYRHRYKRYANDQLLFNSDGSIVFVQPTEETPEEKSLLHQDSSNEGLPGVGDPKTLSPSLHMGDHQYRLGNTSTESKTQCSLAPTNSLISQQIKTTIEEKAKLINYDLSLANASLNPLLQNMSAAYRGNQWTRVARHQGQTILSLAFNYGVLSLMTLTFGVVNMEVTLKDEPQGCLELLSEKEKMGVVMELLMRDFKKSDTISLSEEESVCHQVVQENEGYAFFTYRCCSSEGDGVTILCTVVGKNVWLQILDYILIIAKFVVLFFGPLLAPAGFFSAALDDTRFVIKIKDPLLKTICAVRGMDKVKVKAKHIIDLRDGRYFEKCKRQLRELPTDHIIPIEIERFEIAIDYGKLLTENKVPVGLVRSISHAIFNCGFKDIPPFTHCCETDMFSYLKEMKTPLKWKSFCTALGKLLLVALIPVLFYVRLLFFYSFEYPEISYRSDVAMQNRLKLSAHEFKMMQYLLPSHPLCVTIYCLYGSTVIILAYVGLTGDMKRIKRIIFTSFADMNRLSWLKAFELMCAKAIWPFEKFGVVGCIVAPLYWTLALPFILLAYLIYCLPLVFLTGRLIKYSLWVLRRAMRRKNERSESHVWYFFREKLKWGTKRIEEELLLNEMLPDQDRSTIDLDRPTSSSPRRDLIRGIAVILLVLTVFGVFILGTECIGFIAEILTFTLMGVIVNASSVLKYMTLILLVVMYSFDCYHNVYKKYLKLNKALFSDVKGRMKKKIEEVTSLPAHLQENTGFKACESSEQADYEAPDDISSLLPMHWELNDVIMFIDNEDMPRIPRKLFEQVCEIRVAGSPGPVYRSLIEASKKFMLIIFFLVFVFIVVLSFGSVYKVSSTNQTLATLAGGFVPFIMRNFMQPSTPDIELATVSFSSKLDEIIQNFQQQWPMYDLPFKVDNGQEGLSENGDSREKSTQTPNTSSIGTQTILEHEREDGFNDHHHHQYSVGYTSTSIDSVAMASTGRGLPLQTPDIMTSTSVLNAMSPELHTDVKDTVLHSGISPGENIKPPEVVARGGSSETLYQSFIIPQGGIISPTSQDPFTSEEPATEVLSEEERQIPRLLHSHFEAAAGQEVDLLIVLPEDGDTKWCRVWSNISLYEEAALQGYMKELGDMDEVLVREPESTVPNLNFARV